MVKIFKLLYFFDFDHFKKTGRPVTNLKYYAWDYGPVPRDLYFAIKNNNDNLDDFHSSMKFISQSTSKTEESIVFKPIKKANLKIFTPREKRIMDELIEIYKNETPSTMSEASHYRKGPWDITRKNKGDEEISYNLIIEDSDSMSIEEGEEAFKEYLENLKNFNAYPL
ncbi:Panacea domain-containing protein [Leptospira levettii]|uniref:Panacea domain-containing protein n=1 Tax=Leptospira levettii TaxID=2023178 RepID=UPI00223CB452|nr:Panacea domain-containing protein [Leptospira levettii]MCW7467790.1 Panacea domain-containing protein [Leptospira levettii]MCW7472607.1 Panacea domain-containing protein [Leptospira levettii]